MIPVQNHMFHFNCDLSAGRQAARIGHRCWRCARGWLAGAYQLATLKHFKMFLLLGRRVADFRLEERVVCDVDFAGDFFHIQQIT